VRRSSVFLFYLALNIVLVGLMLVHASHRRARLAGDVREMTALAERFGLTDLCLFTEANYTRHPTQADFHTPFLDGPLALDHFPSGSMIVAPAHLRKPHEPMDRTAEKHP